MKKLLSLLLISVLMLTSLCSCGNAEEGSNNDLTIVTTIFPEYDWVRNILGEKESGVDLTMLLDNGVDLHSYQPTADDIILISTCDLFIYVGGESDKWVDDVLKEAVNKDMIVLDLFDVLGNDLKEEEETEGMEAEAEEEDEGTEYDEHIWLSLKNAQKLVNAIKDALLQLDNENANIYEENASAYIQQLKTLDEEYTNAVSSGKFDTILFADRFPFRYLTDDYNLNYYAAFKGCSAESEASFETITFLYGKLEELQLPAVLTIDGSNANIASSITALSSRAPIKVLTMNSMQSITATDVETGITYLSVMEENLNVLKEALN